MYFSKNKSRLIGLTSVILILLVVFSLVLAGQGNISAQAVTHVYPSNNSAGIVSIDELLLTGRANTATDVGNKSIFDYDNLTALFTALTNKPNATLDDVETEMAKPQYNDTKAGDKTYVPNTSNTGYSNAFVGSIHYGMNSEDIRTLTGGKNIEVTFGGHEWHVVALTTTGDPTDVSAGDVVLTLMLKDPIDGYKTYWNGFQTANDSNHNEKYSSSFYSASMIRSILLNGIGFADDGTKYDVRYTENGSSLVKLGSGTQATAVPNYAADWAIFTDKGADKNVTNFLVKPKDVLYMQDESLLDIETVAGSNNNSYSGQNEASLNKIPSAFGGGTSKWYPGFNAHYQQEKSVYGVQVSGSKQTYSAGDQLYFDWGNDYLWLPSWAEVGEHGTTAVGTAANSSKTGLWALNTNQRLYTNEATTAAQAWLRSGRDGNAKSACTLTSAGGRTTVYVRASEFALRPALNLNLTAAADSAIAKLATPTDVEVEYTGSELDLDFAKAQGAANWWTNSFKDRVNASYYLGQVPGDPKEPGTYTVKLHLKDSDDAWGDGTKTDKTIEFEVIKRKLSFPKWDTTDGGAKPFRGSAGVTFDLYYDGDYLANLHTLTGKDYFDLVDVTTPTGVNKQNKGWKYNAIDAKSYDLTFTIKDTDHYQWKTGAPSDGKLPFEVTKKIINVTLTADDGVTDALTGREGSSVNAILTIPPNQIEVGYDAKITISAQRLHAAPSDVSSEITLSDTSGTENITLDLSDVSANSDLYNLSIDCSSDEYEFVVTNTPTLKVEEDNKNVLRWQLYVGGKAQVGYYIDCDIDDTTKTVTFDKKTIYYTGKYAEFKASATPMGYSLKTTSYNGGYEMNTTDPTSTNTKKGINADDYTTIVDVYKNDDTSVVVTFKINWTIAPALFDMSGVKWLNNGDLPYDGGLAVSAEIDTNTLPKGLKVQAYSTNQGA
ncbi:MAG: hypothetical protein K2M75_00080, partial [Clostridia bacterium]|nr:hypothetical protein [Clostridia bacterium]